MDNLLEHAIDGIKKIHDKWASKPYNRGEKLCKEFEDYLDPLSERDDFGNNLRFTPSATSLNGFLVFENVKGEPYKKPHLKMTASQLCHGGIKTNRPSWTDKFILLSTYQWAYTSGPVDVEANAVFLDWLLNASPWADSFITKDTDYAQKWGVAQRCDVPHPILIGGAIAYRHIWEHHKWISNTWLRFVKCGMNPNLAFVLGQHWGSDGSSLTAIRGWPGHMAVYCIYKLPYYKNFANNKPNVKSCKTFSEIKTYSEVNEYWGKCAKDKVEITELYKKILKDIGAYKETVNKNIFEQYRSLHRNSNGEKAIVLSTDKEIVKFTKEVQEALL